VVSLVFFIVWETRVQHPLVDLRIFRNRNFAVGTSLMVIAGVMIYSTTSLLPMFLQGLMGYPSLNSGMAMSLRGIGAIVAMVAVGKLSAKIDARILINVGWLFLIYSCWQLGNITIDVAPGNLNWPNTFTGLGMGFLMIPLMTASLADVPNEQMGNASGVNNLARSIGGSIGISLTTALVVRGTQTHSALLVGHLSPYRPEFQQYLQSATEMLSQNSDPATAQQQANGMLYGAMPQQANLFAYVDTFRLLAALCALCIPVVFLLRKAKSHGVPVAMH
jgi:DHA2 family multidrug resistance protein